MCESNAYIKQGDKDELVLENVTYVKPENGKLILTSLFGDEIEFDGKIVEIDLMAHRILLGK